MSDSLQLHELWPARSLCPWNPTGKNNGVGSLSFLQESNQGLLHSRQILYHLGYWGSPTLYIL